MQVVLKTERDKSDIITGVLFIIATMSAIIGRLLCRCY